MQIDLTNIDAFYADLEPNETITAMCFHGVTLAIGTSFGRVLLYKVNFQGDE